MTESDRNHIDEIVGRLQQMDIKGVSIDSRNIKEGELFVAIRGDRFDGHDFVSEAIKKGAWGAMVERTALESRYEKLGGLKNIVPVEDTLLALQDMSHKHRQKFAIPLVGVTGSNGKTTTKEMIAGILKQKGSVLKNEGNLNNHIGVPLTLLKLEARHRSAVIEMGMSAAGEIDLLARLASPTVGVITNIGRAHLEFLGSMDGVAAAKAELIENLKSDGAAVLNADDAYFGTLKKKCTCRVVSFGIDRQADVKASTVEQGRDYTDLAINAFGSSINVRLRAVGRHNISNALAAAGAAIALGVPVETVKFGLDDFAPVSMRSEIKAIDGRTVLADYYNANPGSVRAALETLVTLAAGPRTIAVLGDMLELGETGPEEHREIGRTAARNGVGSVIALGPLAQHILEGAASAGMPKGRLFSAQSHQEAADLLRRQSRPGDAVLIKGSRGMKMEKILEEF